MAVALCALSSRADSASYAKVIRERDAVLSQILAERESGRPTGLADEDAITSDRIALYAFRRDVATSVAEKLKNQELIVDAREKQLASIKAKSRAGTVGNIDILMATDRALQAKQVLEQLKLDER